MVTHSFYSSAADCYYVTDSFYSSAADCYYGDSVSNQVLLTAIMVTHSFYSSAADCYYGDTEFLF